MPHFFASNLQAVVLPAQSKNFKFIFEAKSVRDKSAIIFAESTHNRQKILLSKQEKDGRFLVKFNKHFASHSKEIIKSALKEYAQLADAEIVAHNLNENKIKVDSAYMLGWHDICTLLGRKFALGRTFRTCENFGESTDLSLVLSPKFSQDTKFPPQLLEFVDLKNGDSATRVLSTHEANSSIVDEFLGFCEASDDDRTLSPSRKRDEAIPKKSPQDAEFAKDEFAMLEIGFGSGRHILHLAQNHPNARIIGLEIYRPAISQVLRQIELLNLQNLYLASIDARVLFEVLPAQCLDRIFLHFPVPWDKNPQRRVFSEQFLANAMRVLKKDGIFELLTDSAEYFSFAKALAKDYKCVAEEGVRGEVVSKYEARWRKQEKVIYRLCVSNSSANSSCGDFLGIASARFLDEPSVLSASLASHNCKNSSTILEFAPCKNAESALDSAESQNLIKNQSREAQPLASSGEGEGVVREGEGSDFAIQAPAPSLKKNTRGEKGGSKADLSARVRKEIIDSSPSAHNDNLWLDSANSQNLQGGWLLRNARKSFGLPRRFCESARNDNFLDYSVAPLHQNDKIEVENDNLGLDSALMTQNDNLRDFAESTLDSAPFTPKKICKKEYFLHIKNKYIFEGGVVVFASFGAYYAPSSAYFIICGDEVSTISEIIPTRTNIDAVGLFMELCFDN